MAMMKAVSLTVILITLQSTTDSHGHGRRWYFGPGFLGEPGRGYYGCGRHWRPSSRYCSGPCDFVTGDCQNGYVCNVANGMCCWSTGRCPNGAINGGPCFAGNTCPQGFACNGTLNFCCPTCPNNGEPLGVCFPGSACGGGLNCVNNMCCPSSSASSNTA